MALMRVAAALLFLLAQPLSAAATAVISGRLFCDKCNSGIQVPISRGEVTLNCTTYVLLFDGDNYTYGDHSVLLHSSQSTITSADGTFSFPNVYMTDQYVERVKNTSVLPYYDDYYSVTFPVHCDVYVPASAPCTAAAIAYPISNNVNCTSQQGSYSQGPYASSPSLASVDDPQDASTYALGNFCLAPAQTPVPPTCPFPSVAPSLRRLFYTKPVPAGKQAYYDEFGRRLEIAFWNDATGRSVTVLEACTYPYSPHSVEAIGSSYYGYAGNLQVVGENLYFLGRNCSTRAVGVFRKPAAWHPDRYQRSSHFAQPVLINSNYTYYDTFAVDVDDSGKEYVYFAGLYPAGDGISYVTHFAVQTATWPEAVVLDVYEDYQYTGERSPGYSWDALHSIVVDSSVTPRRVWWAWEENYAFPSPTCSVSYGAISPDHRSITNQQLWDFCVKFMSFDQVHKRLFALHYGLDFLRDGLLLSVFNISGEGPVPILSSRPLGLQVDAIAYYAPANYLFFSAMNVLNLDSSDATAYVELSQLVGKAELDACLAVSGSSDEDKRKPCAATGVATHGNRPVHIVTPPPGGSIALFY
eukprot:jgi/Chlat1/6753/Chrsp50S06446